MTRATQVPTARRKLSVVVFLAAVLVVVFGFYYHQWVERYEYLRWLAQKQTDLEQLGRVLIRYDRESKDGFAHDWDQLIRAGVITRDDTMFEDSERGVTVRRELRPIPSLGVDGELVLVLESYTPPQQYCGVLRANGEVLVECDMEAVRAVDNERRRRHGLDPIP